MKEIEERKNIIMSLNPTFGDRQKGLGKRIKYLKIMIAVDLILTLFCGGIIFTSITMEPFGFEFFKWEKMGLITILSLSFVLRLPEETFEIKLLLHLRKLISKADCGGVSKLNSELKNIVVDLNKKTNYQVYFIPLAIMILILGIVQVLAEDLNPYWNYAKVLVVLFFGIVLKRFYKMNKKLTKNIIETENTVANSA